MNENLIYVYIVSLGCSKNFVDTEVMAASLLTHEIGITDDPSEASVFLINTCAFILPAREEAEDHINEALEWKQEDPENCKIIISGCLTQWDKKNVYADKFKEVDLWLGIDQLTLLPEKIAALYSNKKIAKKSITNYKPKYLYDDKTPRFQLTPSHYANIKISEGCDNLCAYCSIPSIRGSLRSRSQQSIITEAKSLLANDVKELLIIAQDTTAFNRDSAKIDSNLITLLIELDKIQGNHWIRLHYLHPRGFSEKLISVLSNSKHIIPYFDIPIQHISDNILKDMNRKISSLEIKNILSELKKKIPNAVIRTTFLVGFPGETEENFQELADFVKEWKFERLGVFPFYLEENTAAATLKNHVPSEVAQKRADTIYAIHKTNSLKFNEKLIGKEFDVLVDSIDDQFAVGRTYMDSPDIDNIVTIPINKNIIEGSFIKVKITDCSEYELNGEII